MRASRILMSTRIISIARINLDRNQKLQQLMEFRKKNYEIQNNEMLDNPYDEVNNLFMEYDSIVHDTIVNDFIRAEQKLVRMMKLVYEQIADDLDFDIIDEDAR